MKRKFRFNTSHVVVYLPCCLRRKALFFVSIHLMLQFISGNIQIPTGGTVFQYISCCSLSKLNYCRKGAGASFNTSHVVVYRIHAQKHTIHILRFNTSHVVVYPSASSLTSCEVFCFNTSHVVVYHYIPELPAPGSPVSIHLMLQFIEITAA